MFRVKSLRRCDFYFFDFNYFVNFMDFFYFSCYKKTNDVNMQKIIITSFLTWNYFR